MNIKLLLLKSICFIAILLLSGICLGFPQVENQTTRSAEDTTGIILSKKEFYKEANNHLKKKNYLAALPFYLTLIRQYPGIIEYKYKAGICYLYKSDEKQKSIEYLEHVLEKEPKTKDLYFYLGSAYHVNYQFDKAIEYFNKTLNNKKLSNDRKKFTERLINNCESGKNLIKNPLDVYIENIGPPINTEGSEYVPVISADESVLIYTYKGEKSTGGLRDKYGRANPKGWYYEDIYVSYKLSDSWLEPEKNELFYATIFDNRIGENINTTGHDASIAISADGQKLFIYKDTDLGLGDIYISELDGNIWTYPLKLNVNINSKYWEGSVSLSADENIIYFSSEKPGGYGGKDIYISYKRDDGIWGQAVNIGSVINTPYDDDAPFIHPDGKTLYFSSKGHNSMGGVDIFYSVFVDDSTWSIPQNIGYPINTTSDDIYYVVSANGKRGYYSSGRLGGYGQQDIYIVHLGKSAKQHAMILVKGKVTANDEFVEAIIKVTDTNNDESPDLPGGIHEGNIPLEEYTPDQVIQTCKSNHATGNYIIGLPNGKNYNLTFNVEGFNPYVENINVAGIDTFMEMVIDVRLYSDDYIPQLNIEGNVLYSEKPAMSVNDVTIFIANDDRSTFKKTVTDKKGYFKFVNLPPEQNYIITLDEDDPDLIVDANTVIIGRILHAGKPKEGVPINKIMTKEDGGFRLESSDASRQSSDIKELEYTSLPNDIAGLDTLYLSSPEMYKEVLKRYGDRTADELVFKIQIAAYYSPKNFDFSSLTGLGEVETQLLDDGITRFTMGKFKTMNKAEEFKHKIIQRDIVDAFTLIFYNGERKYLSDVIANDFYAD
ncbi:MAG: hypothetical protein ABII90_01795 [Bacteroidota bacterium]